MATAFPADCLPPEGYFELQETLYVSINGLNQEAMHLQLNEENGFLTVYYTCNRSRQPPNILDKPLGVENSMQLAIR